MSVRRFPVLAVAAALAVADLAAQQPVRLDTLDVMVSSRVSPALSARTRTVAVLTRTELDALPARSLADALRWMNGVDLQQRGGAQADISLRGAGFEQVLVLVDGVRVSDAQTGHFDLDLTVPLDRVERIEVLRGPASALFGADAVGGVVNIVTRGSGSTGAPALDVGEDGFALGARIEAGSFSTWRISSTQDAVVGAGTISVGQEWATSDGDRPGTDYENSLLNGVLKAPVGGGSLTVSAGYAARDFGAADFYAPIPAYEETRTGRATAGWASAASRQTVVDARVSYRNHDDLFVFFRDDPDSGRNAHNSTQLGGELVLTRRSREGPVSLAVGVEGWRDELESSNLGARSETRGALFSELVMRAGTTSAFTIGVRGDTHETYGDFLSPSVSAAYDVGSGVRLKASLARSFRAPTWTERHYADPFHQASAQIDPERTWSYEVGLALQPRPGTQVAVTVFRNQTEDLIDWAKPDGSGDEVKWVTRNVNEADFTGLELDLGLDDVGGATLSVGVSLLGLDATGEAGFFSKRALQPETRRVTVAASRRMGQRILLAVRGLHARRLDQDAYHQVDLRLSADVPGGAAYVDVLNLTNQDYLDASAQPVPGLHSLLGFRIAR